MKYVIIIAINFILCALFIGLVQWFEKEKESIVAINKKNHQEMMKLQKISKINEKIEQQILQNIQKLPQDFEQSAIKIVKFYDANSQRYNLVVKNYLSSDSNGEKIDFAFKLSRDNIDALNRFIDLEYEGGFLKFSELLMKQKDIMGVIQIIQPHNGKKDADSLKR